MDPAGVLVTNIEFTRKFMNDFDWKYLPVPRQEVSPEVAMDLATRFGSFRIVLLDRNDGPFGIQQMQQNADFIASIEPMKPTLVFDREMSATDRLRIWRVDGASAP